MASLQQRVESLEKQMSQMRPWLQGPLHGMSLLENIEERSTDPEDPPEGFGSLWLADGTDAGDDGDLIFERTAGGTTWRSILGKILIGSSAPSPMYAGQAWLDIS